MFNSGSYIPRLVNLVTSASKIQPLVLPVMEAGIRHGTVGALLSVSSIFENFNALAGTMDRVTRTKFVRHLSEWYNFSTELQKQASDVLFLEIVGCLPADRAEAEAFARFDGFKSEKWGEVIIEGAEAWLLFVRYKDAAKQRVMDKSDLADGLKNAGEKLASDFRIGPMRRWLSALDLLSKARKSSATKDLAAAAIARSNSALFLALTDIGQFDLAKHSKLNSEEFAEKLFADLSRQKNGRTWLQGNGPWLNKGTAQAKNLMRARLFDVIKSRNSERREWANKMLSLIRE